MRLEDHETPLDKFLKTDMGALINQTSLYLVAQFYTISVNCVIPKSTFHHLFRKYMKRGCQMTKPLYTMKYC